MNSSNESFSYMRRLVQPNQINQNSYLTNLFNQDSYYNVLRRDIDSCCEIAIRYGLVIDEERGLLQGGRSIYQDSTLYELRIARLFERYFGNGCLEWDPPSRTGRAGEFLLHIDNQGNTLCSIFTEVKTIEIQRYTEYGTLRSNENSIENALRKAYEKIREGIDIPFLVVLCHNHYEIEISDFQIIKACFGLIAYQNGMPEVISRGFCSPDIHRKLSAIGVYYDNFSIDLLELFEIYHNENANLPIDNHIFENKADKQFYLSEWSGKFN